MPRPKLDTAITQRIVDLVRAGNFLEIAAAAAGIHKTTLHRWLRLGRDQKRGAYRRFSEAVERAQAESEARDVALIAKAGQGDWRAAAWRLERKAPRRYGPRVQIAVLEEFNAALDRLQHSLPIELYEQVLQVLAEGGEGAFDIARDNSSNGTLAIAASELDGQAEGGD